MNNDDIFYEMIDEYVSKTYVDDQHNWLNQYRIESIRLGRMCEKFPALKKSWDEFKMMYELCRSQDDIDRQVP